MKTLRHLRIMAAAVLLLLFACRQEITTIDDHNSKREQEFFRNNATPTARNFGQIAGQISHLREINSRTEFISKLSDKAGLPKWGFSMTTAIGTRGKSGRTADSDVLIIPMQEDANSYLSSLLYVERPGSDNPTIYTVTNLELYDFVRNSDIDAGIREQILSTFIYFDNLVYGNKDFAHLPAELYPEIPLKEGEAAKSFTVTSSGSTDPQGLHYNTICVVNNHCTRTYVCDYGRSCDHCLRECESVNCYTAGGGGYEGPVTDAPGDTGDPGDGGGTGTGTGSGECSRGGWYRIIPPGCPGGGDEELPPAVLALKGAMLNLGAQFDIFAYEGYLTYNVSIAQKFNTYLLQNNNAQGAAFVMWGLEFLSQNTSTTWAQFESWFIGNNNITVTNSINNTNSIKFNSLKDFKNALDVKNVNLVFEKSVINDNGSEKIVSAKIKRTGIWNSGVEILIKLKKINNIWIFDSATSSEYGLTLGAWSFTQLSYSQNTNLNILTVDVVGYENYNIFSEGIGTIYKDKVQYTVVINNSNGTITDIKFKDL